MNERTMQRALGATRKVTTTTLSAGLTLATLALFGCADQEDPSVLGEASGANANADPNAPAPTRPDDPAATSSPAATCADAPCCEALVAKALEGQPDYPVTDSELSTARASLGDAGLACCARLAYGPFDGLAPLSDDHLTCCLIIAGTAAEDANLHVAACTPWGPPMPPSFEEAVG
jgi:hypothetical protein